VRGPQSSRTERRLGARAHSNIAITLQTYSRVLPTVHDDAAATVANTFMTRLGAPPTTLRSHARSYVGADATADVGTCARGDA